MYPLATTHAPYLSTVSTHICCGHLPARASAWSYFQLIPLQTRVEITPEQQCTSRRTARRQRGTGTPAAARREGEKKAPSQRNVAGAPEERKTITFIFRGNEEIRKKSEVKTGFR